MASARTSGSNVALNSRFCRLAGQQGDDASDVIDEAHVQHPVGFVEHEHLDLAQVDGPAAGMVEEAPGRGDEDLDASQELLLLGRHGHTAVDDRDAERQVAAVGPEAALDLDRELAGRGHDERPNGMPRGREAGVGVRLEALEDGQRERRGLAGAGLGTTHQVMAREHDGDGLLLDRGGDRVALIGHSTQDLRAQAQMVEGHADAP